MELLGRTTDQMIPIHTIIIEDMYNHIVKIGRLLESIAFLLGIK